VALDVTGRDMLRLRIAGDFDRAASNTFGGAVTGLCLAVTSIELD